MAENQWWYDLTTKSAVQDSRAGKSADRLGPYPSREDAERALEKVAERNDTFDHDPRWNDD
ncbi:SPOR domain-containing protein [uncultured Friedmanniella sp.]|uniref:SPOR domain-containing protein n=1 Tax=uncultured Friedmanniella sp. TaxID=335381 RepID=UPI0035CB033F